MVKIILHGCSGRMGHIITDICEKDSNTQIVAGVDAFGDAYAGYPVYRTLQDCPEADVIVDFSTASAIDGLLAYSVEKKIPVVVCTTGLSPEQTQMLVKASEETAVLKSANKAANDALAGEYEFVYDRSQRRAKRPVKEIGISAVRGGTIVGDHDVIFAGQDEVITLSHRAYSRAVFGKGAVEAAKFLAGKEAGFYTMHDVLG